MRQIILPGLLLLCAHAYAQDKGFVSGTLSYGSNEFQDDQSSSTLTIGPAVGFNLAPPHVLGLGLNMRNVINDGGNYTNTQTSYEVAPFYRYMKSVGEKCSIYGQFTIGYGMGTYKSESATFETETEFTTIRVAAAPGVWYEVADHWALSAHWGLLQYQGTDTEGESSTALNFGLSPGSIGFALNWLF